MKPPYNWRNSLRSPIVQSKATGEPSPTGRAHAIRSLSQYAAAQAKRRPVTLAPIGKQRK